MGGYAVQPDVLVAGGRRMTAAADEAAAIGAALRGVLSEVGAAAGHPGVAAAAEDAAAAWRAAAHAWAAGGAALGGAVVEAAGCYADVDAGQIRHGVLP